MVWGNFQQYGDILKQEQVNADANYKIVLDSLNAQMKLYQANKQKKVAIMTEELIATAKHYAVTGKIKAQQLTLESQVYAKTQNDMRLAFRQSLNDMLHGNNTLKANFKGTAGSLKEDYKQAFLEIRGRWIITMQEMAQQQGKLALGDYATNHKGTFLGKAAGVIAKYVLHSGGRIPLTAHAGYKLPGRDEMMIKAQGGERVLNRAETLNYEQDGSSGGGQGVVIAMSPTFQNLDPHTGQKMFQEWMKTSGISMVNAAVQNNSGGLRHTIRSV